MPFLATTASITPYIGLFGTVWGIMAAFQGIGATGSTNLARRRARHRRRAHRDGCGPVRGHPGRLFLQPPVASRVKLLATEMDDFSLEFLNISERNFS